MTLFGHEKIVSHFAQLVAKKNLSHAYLFSGPLSLGKTTLILHLVRQIVCKTMNGCNRCASCQAWNGATHSDFALLDPDATEKPESISIDAIREAARWMQFKPSFAETKVQAIVHADRLPHEAANALLKVLEEPPPGTVLLLGTEFPSRLPITLRSRCYRFRIAPIPDAIVTDFLTTQGVAEKDAHLFTLLARGSPGIAYRLMHSTDEKTKILSRIEDWLSLLQEPERAFKTAEAHEGEKQDVRTFFSWGQILLHDLLRIQVGTHSRLIEHVASKEIVRDLIKRYPKDRVLDASRSIIEAFRFLETNASKKLIIEHCFLSL